MFYRPTDKKMSFLDMAKYVDHNMYSPDRDDLLAFQCLATMTEMLTRKYRLIDSESHIADFSIFCASYMFERYTKGKSSITSSDRYLKAAIYTLKKWYFKQFVYTRQSSKVKIDYYDIHTFEANVYQNVFDLNRVEFRVLLDTIPNTIRYYMRRIVRVTPDTPEWNDIYISCLLSFINSVTPPVKADYAVLYGVCKDMKPYIMVLTRKLSHLIAKDMSAMLYQNTSAHAVVNALIQSNTDSKVDE